MPSIPQPFKNPSIDLSSHGKEWLEVYPSELAVGDHVMNFGIIAEIRTEGGLSFIFAGKILPIQFDAGSKIQAFTASK